MPELARFFGIVISIFYEDHDPPHVHASNGNRGHAEWMAQITINDGVVLEGGIPRTALRLIRRWMQIHHNELLAAWEKARNGVKPGKIAPLRVR